MKTGPKKSSLIAISCFGLIGLVDVFGGQRLVLAQSELPTLPTSAPETAPENASETTSEAAPQATPNSEVPPVPFRPGVQPIQTQPRISQPLPAPLAPALPFNSSDVLKPGDMVAIDVLGFPNLSGQQQISSNGTIQLPLGGPIFIGGYSPVETLSILKAALLPYVRRPEVSIALVNASPLRVSVSGEVLRPGPRLLTPAIEGAQGQNLPPTLSTALVESGGITPSADLRNIVIRRAVPTRTAGVAAPYGEFRVDLWEAVSTGNLQADPRVYDGDEIIVPTADVANIDQRTLLSSTVAPSEITVQVAGEVNQPGQLSVSPVVGVSGAVAAAGGPTPDADKDEITLLRMMPDGRVEELIYAFGEASEPLVEGDVVYVEPSTRGRVGGTFDFLGRILSPIGRLFGIF
ncbi:MAG: SLBB domain-containing protein [Phormidesmis sp.]